MPLQHNNPETTQKFVSTSWVDRTARNLYLFLHAIFSLESHMHNPLPKAIKHQAPNFINGSKNMRSKSKAEKISVAFE
jgi:hypothetical protein